MDEQKVCFICCTNNLIYEKECRMYLENLIIPEGIQTEIKMVHGAASMAAGYNRAMGESDAKYKVYLHQDVFLLNRNFITDMLHVFEEKSVGMLGVMGSTDLPTNGIAYASWNQGRLKTNTSFRAHEVVSHMKKRKTSVTVTAVDGLLIATQYDLPWREDLFDGWDFYDISQSLEFKKAGYLVKVPKQETSWCFHDDGFPNLIQYEKYRKIFVREYGSYLRGDDYADQVPFDEKIWNIVQKLKVNLIQLFDDGKYQDIYAYLSENYQMMSRDADLALMGILMQIWDIERKQVHSGAFLEQNIIWEKVKAKYQKHKFWLYEMEFRIGNGERQIVSEIRQNKISADAIFVFIMHNTIEKAEMFERFAEIYHKEANINYAQAFRREACRLKKEAENKPLKVIMVAHNQMELVQQSLNALLHTAGISLDDIILVDNASEDGLRQWISEQGISKFIVCEGEMESYSVILNAVIQEFQISDDILILPPEYIVMPGAVREMQRVLHLQDDTGAVSASVISFDSEHGKDYAAALAYAQMKQEAKMLDWEGLTSIPAVVMIKNNMRVDAEMFDTSLVLPENCVQDFLYRGTEEDYQLLMCKKAFCYQAAADGDGYLERFGENADQAVLKEKSDEGIAEIEQMCRQFAKIRVKELPGYQAKINRLLQDGNRMELSDMLLSQEFQDKFQTVTDMVYMILANQIYMEEISENVARTIFDGRNSIDEIMCFFQEIKFALWRLEFDMEEEPGTKIIDLVQKNQISSCLLKYAVHVAGMDKVGLLGRLAGLFLDRNMPGMAFSMLKYADELQPGTEEILCTMAELCLQAGKREEALYCLEKVEKPTKYTETFRKMCEQ